MVVDMEKRDLTGVTHLVTVGKDNFMYQPNNITAAVGDVVVFQIYPTNHSVIQGEYCGNNEGGCNPCVPINLMDSSQKGFSSPNFLTQQDASPTNLTFQTFNLTINDTNPIWFYCDAINSCVQQGMVGVINGANNTSVDKQIALAKAAPYQLAFGQSLPSSTNSTNNTSSPTKLGHKSGLSGGAIAGIVVGAVVLISLIAAITYLLGRNKAQGEQLKRQSQMVSFDTEGQKNGNSADTSPYMQQYSINSTVHPSWITGMASPLRSPQPGQTFNGHNSQSLYPPSYPGNPPESPAMGTFVGYNRQTGVPEYAQEAPVDGNETLELPGEIQYRDIK